MAGLLSVREARGRLLEKFKHKAIEIVPLSRAGGRVLGEAAVAQDDYPYFANSSMDGFAVRSVDLTENEPGEGWQLEVVADIPAGKPSAREIGPGEAARIMTGAPLPPGADTVVPVENTDFNYREEGLPLPKRVRILKPFAVGAYVRPAGEDFLKGETLLPAGRRLKAQDLGMLAMLGIANVPVFARPRVALLSTGDELLPVDAPLSAGKIHDSNSYTLSALVEQFGGQATGLGIVPDKADAVKAALDRAVDEGVDLILSSAGVSVGAFDFVRTVVENQGALDFWRVNMRPGKPLAFGSYRGVPFIGLPGNPVSSFVGFLVFVAPALEKMAGLQTTERLIRRAKLVEAIESDGRESYLRAIADETGGGLTVRLTGHQGSGNLRSLVQANALIIVPAGVESLPKGASVKVWLIKEVVR